MADGDDSDGEGDRDGLPRLLTTVEAAEMLRMSPRSLEGMRLDGTGPDYIKLGLSKKAKVVYRLTDIKAWLRKNTHHS